MHRSRWGSVRGALAIGLAVVATGEAAAEVKDATPQGFTTENVEVVPVTPAAAWRALVDDVNAWWPRDHVWWKGSTLSIDPRAGGCFCEIDGRRQARHLEVVFVDPEKTLRLSGALGPLQGMGLTGVVEFRLAPADGGGTRVVMFLRAGGYTPDDLRTLAPVVDRVNRQQLGALASHLRR
jgi:uncharacterized protein YndB with AHSA1/START domain